MSDSLIDLLEHTIHNGRDADERSTARLALHRIQSTETERDQALMHIGRLLRADESEWSTASKQAGRFLSAAHRRREEPSR